MSAFGGKADRSRRRWRLCRDYETVLAIPLIRITKGKSNMPSKIDVYLIGVWFCVGFFTGAGWAVAAWLVGRILSVI